VHGNIRYSRMEKFDPAEMREFMKWASGRYARAHILISDGIIFNVRSLSGFDLEIAIQRVLNPHQLQNILISGDSDPYFIAVMSDVASSWPMEIAESIYEVMRIKAYSLGCYIFFFVFGNPWIYEYMFTGCPRTPASEFEG
jgi:hypothetical protein